MFETNQYFSFDLLSVDSTRIVQYVTVVNCPLFC